MDQKIAGTWGKKQYKTKQILPLKVYIKHVQQEDGSIYQLFPLRLSPSR